MDTAAARQTRPTRLRPIKFTVEIIWKTPVLIIALVLGMVAANSVGWNGGAWLLGRANDSEGLGGFISYLILFIGVAVCVVVLYLVARIAKWALLGFIPLMIYAAFVLGTWDGVASGFDATRVEAIRHHYANAYTLQHMRSSAVDDTCRDARITLTADAREICSARGD